MRFFFFFIVCFSLLFQLLPFSQVYAQELTPSVSSLKSPNEKTQKNFLENFIDRLFAKKVPEGIERFNRSQLPLEIEIVSRQDSSEEKKQTVNVLSPEKQVDSFLAFGTVAHYQVAAAIEQPNQGITNNVFDFWGKIFGGILDIFKIIPYGDKAAQEISQSKLPANIEEEEENTPGQKMEKGIDKLKCLYLPLEVSEEICQ